MNLYDTGEGKLYKLTSRYKKMSSNVPQIVNVSNSGRLPHELDALVEHYAGIIGKPSTVGPGGWSIIHSLAKWATTPERTQIFIMIVQVIINTLQCSFCRGHATSFFGSTPPSKYENYINEEGRNIGMFYWSWIFHNTVNQRLRKPLMDLDIAFALYPEYQQGGSTSSGTTTVPTTPCTGNCGNNEPAPAPAPVTTNGGNNLGQRLYPIQPHQYTDPSTLPAGLPIMKSTVQSPTRPNSSTLGGYRPGGTRRK